MPIDRYLAFYKPYDVLCQFTPGDVPGRATLADYVHVPDVYPAGRLDRDSEGLLLLTTDGALQHRLTDPKFEHPRTYYVQVEGAPSEQDLKPLRLGVHIQEYVSRPAKVRVLNAEPGLPPRTPPIRYRANIPATWIEITLTEGRNRQVRRMTASIGFPTLRLVRIAIGALRLGELQPGQWRDLSEAELAGLRNRGGQVRPPRKG